jgi:hypothetical protein
MSEARLVDATGTRGVPAGRAGLFALGAAGLLATAALAGCASGPKPTAQLVRASTLVDEAQKSQAQRYAAADLQRARDELNDARTAESNHNYHSALRLAQRAAADADLASARAASGQAQQSATQVRHSLRTLREQLQQSAPPAAPAVPADSGDGDTGQEHR